MYVSLTKYNKLPHNYMKTQVSLTYLSYLSVFAPRKGPYTVSYMYMLKHTLCHTHNTHMHNTHTTYTHSSSMFPNIACMCGHDANCTFTKSQTCISLYLGKISLSYVMSILHADHPVLLRNLWSSQPGSSYMLFDLGSNQITSSFNPQFKMIKIHF